MARFSERLDALTPAQRELLTHRLKEGRTPTAPTEAVVPAVAGPEKTSPPTINPRAVEMKFSLFFFSDDGSKVTDDKYRLVFESAKYADECGFNAVWTPERHFQAFGGLYPNPSVLSAALAMETRRIHIRAGSVALPLHNPIRVAEEWSLVDNLSMGRVGVSFASGWNPHDFALAPHNYERRKEVMLDYIKIIQRLWAGEAVRVSGVKGDDSEVRIYPTPVQKRLPIWITSSASPQSWVRAAELGANVLTGMQGDTLQQLTEKIALYRAALAGSGYDPAASEVAVMLHTFVGDDQEAVKERVRRPLTDYLRTFMAQSEHLDADKLGVDPQKITESDRDALALFAFERFFHTSSLLGTPQHCSKLVDKLEAIGVDEIACLIDFGLDLETVLEGLRHLNFLRQQYSLRA